MLILAQVKALSQRLAAYGINTLKEPQITYALRSRITNGDLKEALELLVIFEDSVDGILREYNPNTKLLGAENRCAVTCYLDSLLFAMFARLDCFEAMLFDTFADTPRRRLATILRLWVNLLRAGKLITVDIVGGGGAELSARHIANGMSCRRSTFRKHSPNVVGKRPLNYASRMPRKLSHSLPDNWNCPFSR